MFHNLRLSFVALFLLTCIASLPGCGSSDTVQPGPVTPTPDNMPVNEPPSTDEK